MSNAIDTLAEILDRVNARQDVCAHVTLEDVTGVDGYVEAEDMALGMLASIVDALATGQIGQDVAIRGAGHVIVVMVALGMALGRDDVLGNLETFASLEVPEDIAALDFLEPVKGDN